MMPGARSMTDNQTQTDDGLPLQPAWRHVLLRAALLASLVGVTGCKRESDRSDRTGGAPGKAPHVRDAELAALLKQGAPTCEVYYGGTLEACPEAAKVTSYVAGLPTERRADAGETCAAFLSSAESNTALLAATCLEGLDAKVLTSQLPHALGVLGQKPDVDVRQAIARAFRRADASAAGVESAVLAYVRLLDEEPPRPSTSAAVAFLVETLFVNGEGATSPAVQTWAVEALATARNQQLAALAHWARIVDKQAGCDALVTSVRRSSAWLDTMTIVMKGHDCDARLVDFFAALVEKVPRDNLDTIVTVLQDIDARVEVPAAMRALAATRLHERHERDAKTMRADELSQRWLRAFASGAAHFAAPRPPSP